MSGTYVKKTTGLFGLAVAKNPRRTLLGLYGKILRVLQQMPGNAAYRKYTEEIVSRRSSIVKETPKVQDIEDAIDGGQVEELIVQAENELFLARKMVQWKPWQPLATEPDPDQWKWPPNKLPDHR